MQKARHNIRATRPRTALGAQAQAAREAAGFSLEAAAKRVRIVSQYLRHVERQGRPSTVLAYRLAALYQCSINIFYIIGLPLPHPRRRRNRIPEATSNPATGEQEA